MYQTLTLLILRKVKYTVDMYGKKVEKDTKRTEKRLVQNDHVADVSRTHGTRGRNQ